MLMLLAPLLGRLKWVVVAGLLAGAAWGYWMWSRAELRALHQQVQSVQEQAAALQVANQAMQTDIRQVQDALANANASIGQIRADAARQAVAIRSRALGQDARSNPSLVQQQINEDTSNALRGLEDASRP